MIRSLLIFLTLCFSSMSYGQTITNVSPNSGNRGTLQLPISITGSGTNFSSATSTVVKIENVLGAELEVLSVSSISAQQADVNIRISNMSATGAYTIRVYDQSIGDFVSLNNGFTVLPNAQPPTLSGTTPETAAVGQTLPITISVDDASFVQATDNTIYLSQQATSTLLYPVPGSIVVLNNQSIRAWFDMSDPSISVGSILNSHCGNSFDGYFFDFSCINVTAPTSVTGTINYTGAYNGVVEIYQENTGTSPSTYSLVSTATVGASNGYQFNDLAQASYLLRSVPIGMPNLVATYYPSDISWQNATTLTTNPAIPSTGIDITPVTSLSLPGGVTVNGSLGYGPNGFNLVGDTVAAAGVEVFLMDTDNTLYAQTVSDANGNYTFSGVPNGNYEIVVNLPGFNQISTYAFNVSSTSPNLSGLTFLIDDGYVFRTSSIGIDELDAENFMVYPNPTNDELNILLPVTVSNASLMIFNHLGQVILEQSISGKAESVLSTDVSTLSKGFYTIRITGDNYSSSSKMIKR